MEKERFDEHLHAQLKKLEEKYESMGQDLSSYLDGLLYSDYLTYWDYIHLDTLLSLQTPRTDFPDEKVFIIYHQITELYLRLILNEQEQALYSDSPDDREQFLKRVKRMDRYVDNLVNSFDVMIDGMDRDQFLAFRMSLLPSSGFQSAQFRNIEINSTDFFLLTSSKKRNSVSRSTPKQAIYEHLYWKHGATELGSGKKTLTLRQFEKKYATTFIEQAEAVADSNFRQRLLTYFREDLEIRDALKRYDYGINVRWPLCHFKSAARYLHRPPEVIEATGGTNWQEYLPPRKQMIQYYPELWGEDELRDWGTSVKYESSSSS